MPFAEKLIRALQKFVKELEKPDSFVKGEAFEHYVRQHLFPSEQYVLLYKTMDYTNNSEDFAKASLKPDFKFKDRNTGKEFFVEAKYRKGTYNYKNQIEWCTEAQLRRYRAINKFEAPVFVVLGIGNRPDCPEDIVLFPMSKCGFVGLYDSFIEQYAYYKEEPVQSKELWRLLVG